MNKVKSCQSRFRSCVENRLTSVADCHARRANRGTFGIVHPSMREPTLFFPTLCALPHAGQLLRRYQGLDGRGDGRLVRKGDAFFIETIFVRSLLIRLSAQPMSSLLGAVVSSWGPSCVSSSPRPLDALQLPVHPVLSKMAERPETMSAARDFLIAAAKAEVRRYRRCILPAQAQVSTRVTAPSTAGSNAIPPHRRSQHASFAFCPSVTTRWPGACGSSGSRIRPRRLPPEALKLQLRPEQGPRYTAVCPNSLTKHLMFCW